MDNMRYYDAARAVPPEAQKTFNNGSFSGTDINPMWRIKKLTEMFGPAGVGWYTEVVSERAETYGETVMAIVDINLYINVDGEWSKPIFGTGGNLLVQATKSGARPSDEGYKKSYTDALSIACKALGIGADIWYSKDPDVCDPTSKYSDKYVRGTREAAQQAGEQKLKKLEHPAQEPAQKMATEQQKQQILDNIIVFTDEEVMRMNERFGGSLENLSYADACKVIKMIDKRVVA